MRGRAIVQLAGAILSGANVAVPLWIDMQGLLPQWPWQLQALISFAIFTAVIGWAIIDKQGQITDLKSGRPTMVIGNRIKASTAIRESEMDIILMLLFRNAGVKPAYQVIFRVGIAPAKEPQAFYGLQDETTANPIAPDTELEHGRDITLRQKSQKDAYGNLNISGAKDWLIYSAIKYSDSPSGGKLYEDEWWFYYKAQGRALQDATLKQRQELECYVRKEFSAN